MGAGVTLRCEPTGAKAIRATTQIRSEGAWVGGDAPVRYFKFMARVLILLGVSLIVIGLLWEPLTKLGLGRLPGDIVVRRENFTLYVPITSAIVVSVILSVVLTVIRAFLGR